MKHIFIHTHDIIIHSYLYNIYNEYLRYAVKLKGSVHSARV